MAAPRKMYETTQPWEEHQGTLLQRVTKVSHEARRVYAEQEALLPTIHHEYELDHAIGDHLQDVGRRIRILHENTKKPDKKALKLADKLDGNKRVIPCRFPEISGDDDVDNGGGEDNIENGDDGANVLQKRFETMLMDQEWDTRTWNQAKIRTAIETLYEQVEHSDDPRRRELATTMLTRLLETHECAVAFVESTVPILMNKAFRNLSKKDVDKAKTFRVCTLLAVLAEWFAPILSRNNAIVKSMAFLLRESELCARIVQHHWRGVVLDRSLQNRDIDSSVRTRIKSMHFVKNIELRHQFKLLRVAIGPEGLPIEALRAYITVLFYLVKPTVSAVDKNRHHSATADQKRLLASGILVVLASLIPASSARIPIDQRGPRRVISELVKGITLELTTCFSHEADKVMEILKSNIIQRVVTDMDQQLTANDQETIKIAHSCLHVIAAVTKAVWSLCNQYRDIDAVSNTRSPPSSSSSSRPDSSAMEAAFLMKRLRAVSLQFLMTAQVMETLLRVLLLARTRQDAAMCELVLSTLRSLAGSYGFKPLLDALTRNGGRALEQVVLCFDWADAARFRTCSSAVVYAAVALFHDMTAHADARAGFTTAGAVAMLAKWCDMGVEHTKQPARFLLALCCIALLARQQHPTTTITSSGWASSGNLLASLGSLEARQDALYAILLELVSGSPRETQAAAVYLHQMTNVFTPIVLRFLVQVTPSDMEPRYQTSRQRSISCVVLGRLCKTAAVCAAAFSEATVVHVALALQCNRLDEIEGKLHKTVTTDHDRRLHYLGLTEACKALSRLARCSSCPNSVNLALKPSITSPNVPQLPQAIVCDVVVARMHVLEDILPLIHVPSDAFEFPELENKMIRAAIELVGYMRPMPYSEHARQRFLYEMASHAHGIYANEKLALLVRIAAPMILHVLKEKHCGWELVAVCCATLSRLAATNAARSALLHQGALFIALTHVPEVLYDRQTITTKKPTVNQPSSPMRIDASVDDQGLLQVPASLFTLVAKLCAISEGREAVMKAQVLPRVLKRLQLRDTKRPTVDIAVKSEIAMLIQRLALCHAVEGNTSELFLHFHVMELLAEIVACYSPTAPVDSPHTPAKTKQSKPSSKRTGPLLSPSTAETWRVLDNVAGALAALAQDVMVCVPTLVALDVVRRLAPLLDKRHAASEKEDSHQHHVASLQRHIVSVARAIASYPFGEFHTYLLHVQGSEIVDGQPPLSFMDHVKTIAYDFTLELQARTPTFAQDHKTIGELARETLALIREREHVVDTGKETERERERLRQRLLLPVALSCEAQTRSVSPPTSRQLCSPVAKPLSGKPQSEIFPVIGALSPKRDSMSSPSLRERQASERASSSIPSSPTVPSTAVRVGSLIAPGLPTGLDLLATRPPPKPETSSTPGSDPHYIFARPKQTENSSTTKTHRNKKSNRRVNSHSDPSDQFLMLDPLFQTAPARRPRGSRTETATRHEERGNRHTENHVDHQGNDGFAFVQDVSHYGHQVNVRARRSRAGDKYIPSLGHLQVHDPTMNVFCAPRR